MSEELTLDWQGLIIRASLLLTLTGCCAALLLKWRPPADSRWHRAIWGVVLVQGIMLFPLSLQLTLPAWWPKTAIDSETTNATNISDSNLQAAANQSGSADLNFQQLPESDDSQRDMQSTRPSASVFHDQERGAFSDLNDEHFQLQASPDNNHTEVSETAALAEMRTIAIQTPTKQAAQSSLPPFTFSWTVVAGIIWMTGVAAVLGILTTNFVLLQRALRFSRTARPRWTHEFHNLCLELGLTHTVKLEVHPVLGPFLCWTPRGHRVIVPVRLWNKLSESERLAVLHHELCHLRRGDLWKAFVARIIVALHWFNPLAWYSARRFDESAEWACDARMATESPVRIAPLANALLSASESGNHVPYLALSVTGGPLFQRVRRLVSGEASGDHFMHKCLWISLILAFAVIGTVQISWASPGAAQETEVDELDDSSAVEQDDEPSNEEPSDNEGSTDPEPDDDSPDSPDDAQLKELSERIKVGDNESLKKFVALIQTPTGRIVMADRAATTAQEAESNADPVTQWQQFVSKFFDRTDETTEQPKWILKPDMQSELNEYVQAVSTAAAEIDDMQSLFRDVSEKLVDREPISPILKRFLQHEGAAAFVYHAELRTRLHPGTEQLEEHLGELLVRTRSGTYVIRPTRRAEAERRLNYLNRLQGPLSRFEKELAAWSADIHAADEEHKSFAETLRNPEFARYLAFYQLYDESAEVDQAFDGVFGNLEEATTDTAEGLKLNLDSDQYKEIKGLMDRFQRVWDYRDSLSVPIARIAERLEASDELHLRMRAFLKSKLALFSVVREMDYVPVDAAEAAGEWLSQIVTRNEAGNYEITAESVEDLNNRLEEFFRQFREVRRHGRVVNEFAAEVVDTELRAAMESLIGKLLLERVVQDSAERPEVDGLELWIGGHFEETPDGLVLRDWAADVVTEILNDAAEIEKELAKQDF